MAQDATGTVTSILGLPTINTAVDAPSGKGINAMMQAIDGAVAGKPSGLASGEVPVWNGSTWVRSSVTNIGPTSLGSGTPDSTKFLRGDGVWATAGAPTYLTTLPGSPVDGQLHILVDNTSAPTWSFNLRYNSTDAKWSCIGGTGIYAEVVTAEAHGGGGTYTALTTAGPSITLPFGGDWFVDIGFNRTNSVNDTVPERMSYDIGGTGAVDADSAQAWQSASNHSVMRRRKKTGLTAVTLTAKYKASAAITFENRWMYVFPIRIS